MILNKRVNYTKFYSPNLSQVKSISKKRSLRYLKRIYSSGYFGWSKKIRIQTFKLSRNDNINLFFKKKKKDNLILLSFENDVYLAKVFFDKVCIYGEGLSEKESIEDAFKELY